MRFLITFILILALLTIVEASAITFTQLTTDPGTDWMPSWSPDGGTIVYVSSPNVISHYSDASQDIWVIPVFGGWCQFTQATFRKSP